MSGLSLRNVSKRFGTQTVIPGLDLDVADGEFVALVGPSGCGKSTLLRMIAGLEEISGGDLLIDGARANDLPPQRRNIAMVFQSYALFPHMTVRENIAFGPMIRGEGGADRAAKVEKAAAMLNLTAWLDRYPRQLSGGQRQRVAMGRAVVRDPSLFLFDEPLSNLDAQLRLQMRTEIKVLHQRLGSTTVYVTHDQIEAMTMADRIVVMQAGRIEQQGPPLELYDRPATRFVAGFIGSPPMNFMDATGAGDAVTLAGGLRIAVPAQTGRPVTLGLRPEQLIRSDAPDALPLAVEVVEPSGAETVVFGRIADAPARIILRDRDLPAPGGTIGVMPQPGAAHLFDPATGLRL